MPGFNYEAGLSAKVADVHTIRWALGISFKINQVLAYDNFKLLPNDKALRIETCICVAKVLIVSCVNTQAFQEFPN